MDKDCPVCNGANFEDLIDTPGVLDLCLKHLIQWLNGYEEPIENKSKEAGIKPSELQETPVKTKI